MINIPIYKCVVCFITSNEQFIILPCGHQQVCDVCYNKIIKLPNPSCPICRYSLNDLPKQYKNIIETKRVPYNKNNLNHVNHVLVKVLKKFI